MPVEQEGIIKKASPKKSSLHSILIIITTALILLNVSMTFVYFVTGGISSFTLLGIASIAGFFLGPLFLMVLGSYLVRSRTQWQRVGFGILVFLAFHVSEGFYQWLNGAPNAFLNSWPHAPFYAELVFIPAYAVITVALSTIYLYLLPQKQNLVGRMLRPREYFWTRFLVPLFLLISTWSHIYGLSSLSMYHTIPLMVVTSLLSIGALPDLKQKLEEQLGHQGSQIFTIIIIGYSSSLTIITTIQFGGISLTNVDFYLYFIQSNLQMIGFAPEEKIKILFALKILVDFCAITTCLYLAYVAFKKNGSVIHSSIRICKHCFSFVLPIVLILSVAQFFVMNDLAYVESSLNYSDNPQNQTGKIQWQVEHTNLELLITVCGEHEHDSTYSKGETIFLGFDPKFITEDKYSIQRTMLTKNPSKQYINSFDVNLECSELKLIPETEWTTLNTIVSTNSSFAIVYIDGDSSSNFHITRQNTAVEAESGAYALLLWMVLIPAYLVRLWRNNSKPPNQRAPTD